VPTTPGQSERVLRVRAAPDSLRCAQLDARSITNPGRRYVRKRPALCPGVTAAKARETWTVIAALVLTSPVGDELVAGALAFIAANSGRSINIQDVLNAVPASRRNLERRFRDALGHGPATEIRRRLLEARRLLAETDLPVKAIAAQCGFSNPEQLQRLFRVETSFTPSQYHEAHRRPRPAGVRESGT